MSRADVLVSTQWAEDNLTTPGIVFVEVDEDTTAYDAGHIPGALNIPWARTTNEDGTFKTDDEIAAIYEQAGISWGKPSIAYCRIGERSSHSWFVIHELLGHRNIKNYDGSWTEYGSLVGVPIALGG